jgi:hypothetical protein
MESSPASPLEVIQPDLLLHLLVVAFDAPAELREPDKLLQRDIGGERCEPELRGLIFIQGPFVYEPLLVAGRLPLKMMMGAPHAHRTEGRLLAATRSFSPSYSPASLPFASHCQRQSCHWLLLAILRPARRVAPVTLGANRWRRDRPGARCPENLHPVDPDDVVEPSRSEPISVLCDVARPLMQKFDELLLQHAAIREIFGLI